MSEERKMVLVNADNVRDGDTFKAPFRRVGGRVHLVYGDGTLADSWWTMPGVEGGGGFFTGVAVDESDITRAPVPSEVVTVEYEVLREGECATFGDIVYLKNGGAYIEGYEKNVPWDQKTNPPIARVLRPIKKP